MKLIFIAVSVAIHCLIVFSMRTCKTQENKKPDKGVVSIKVNSEKEGALKQVESGQDKPNFVIQDEDGIIECEHFYYGIGWIGGKQEAGWCEVTDVAPRSPLDRIGVTKGYWIKATDEGCPGRGPEATEVIIYYKNSISGVEKVIILNREKICMN